ncbi:MULTISPECIES: hypothetical protein [Nitrosomonas]|nr:MULTISPECIES: hypothetical protein [Nitrosomonas]UVS61138.1 hypothetical protein NX761_16885 [Nitrosomonas sp. PLL12]
MTDKTFLHIESGAHQKCGSMRIKPVSMQITEPFKQRGVANLSAVFEF